MQKKAKAKVKAQPKKAKVKAQPKKAETEAMIVMAAVITVAAAVITVAAVLLVIYLFQATATTPVVIVVWMPAALRKLPA